MSTVTPPAMSHGTLAPVSGSCAPTAAGVLVDELGVADALVEGFVLDDAEAVAPGEVVALADALFETLALADGGFDPPGPGGVATAGTATTSRPRNATASAARIFFTSGTPDGVGGPAAGRRPDVR
jgi:hypothetical protein